MNKARSKHLQLSRVLVFLCTFFQLTLPLPLVEEDLTEGVEDATKESVGETMRTHPIDQLHTSDFKASVPTKSPPLPDINQTVFTSVAPESATNITAASPGKMGHISKYPADLFSIKDRRQGWVILHIIGTIYMLISLTVVCDEFFVPALRVITEKLAISDDVTGATFMAAGCSAPKLFTFLIGFFMSHRVMGIGIIFGPAVFNILFVVGMCALLSREELHLTWWPLFRDVSFYLMDLILLIFFLLDNVIMWWESMMLVISYALYMIFMKFNVQIERVFKNHLRKNKNTVKVALEEPERECLPAREEGPQGDEDATRDEDHVNKDSADSGKNDCNDSKNKEEKEKKRDKPLSLKWPDTPPKQAIYLLLLPVIVPLWLTVPDVRKKKSRRLFVLTFLNSIVWISFFSYFMVWWANQVGETFSIADPILTVLGAEMSMPDLIPSVIVARKGLGDMAVSSSMGRNIFCITVCLAVPWFLSSSFHSFSPVPMSRNGLFCAVTLLLLSLIAAVTSISSCKWKTNKVLGLTLLMLFFIFLVISLMFSYHVIVCPL